MSTLVARSGPMAGRRVPLSPDLTIGREDADLVIGDPQLSRRHVVFRESSRGLEIADLGSSNGTFVDGRRIDGPTPLAHGSVVTVGASQFVVELAAEPAAAIAVPDTFAMPAVRHGGLATRSWVPLALSYGSAIAAAVALVVYFAAR